MGVLFDSTFFISAERRGLTAKQTLAPLLVEYPDQSLAISAITLMELSHGVERADTPRRAELRKQFLDQVISVLDVQPVTEEIALRSGHLSGELMRSGVQIATADLLIGVTALHLQYSLVTRNLRHFDRVPGLTLISH
jgi:tRNA(fMet)-specific endonuclease VapC